MLAFISPFMIPLAAAAAGLAYLRRALLPDAPSASAVSEPYTPPFAGGQCTFAYRGILDVRVSTNPSQRLIYSWGSGGSGSFIAVGSNPPTSSWSAFTISGKINTVTFDLSGSTYRFFVNGIHVASRASAGGAVTSVNIAGLVPASGGADNCGDLPNLNPAPPIPSDGLADAPPPNLSSDPDLVMGAPLVTIPSVGALIAAAAAALSAAASTAAGLVALMNAIKAIGDALDKLKEWLEDKDKDDDTKKTLRRHDYGSIKKDGFLRLYPNGEGNGFEPKYIDLQMLSIPISYGRFFGNLSPNFYRFQSLGYIAFVSPTFGVLSVHEIEFSRCSMTVPANAFGFFYHLGLDDTLRANVSMFYLQNE